MALVNEAKKEIHAKIVYYGPGRSGKTTNLEFIYNKLKPEYRGKFKFMNTPSGRMVFFDFMRPELAAIKDFGIHFHVYTVPGESVDPSVWKSVLKGVDGIVFVADLEPSRTLENLRSMDSLKEYLQAFEMSWDETSFLCQCNKKDADGAVSVDEIRQLLDLGDVPVIPASARSGEGVLPALSEMVKMVLQRLRDLPLGREPETAPVVEEALPTAALAEETGDFTPLEPVSLTDDTDMLTLEPVEEDVDYTLEPVEEGADYAVEPDAEEVLPEPAMPDFAVEPEPLCAEQDKSAAEELEPAESGTGMATSFQIPAWGFAPEPELPVPAEASNGLGDWEVSGKPDELQVEIELEGGIEALGAGRFRLPLVVRCGERETRTALSFDVSLEKPGPR